MSDRIAGIVILCLSIWYGYTAGSYQAGFTDPLGPAAFPQMLSVPAGLFSLFLIFRPDPAPDWISGTPALRQVAAVALLIGYALFLDELGFILATIVAVTVLARLLGAGWLKSFVSASATSLLLFCVFDLVLGLPLRVVPGILS